MKEQYGRFLLVAGMIVLVDQITKEIIMHFLSRYESIQIIPGFFALTHIRNTGGAFGLLAGETNPLRTLFFLGASCLALGTIFYLHIKMSPGKPYVAAALAMIFGGALGNLIDRLRFGEVVDFLDFYVGTIHWPAFNVADSAISVGVGIFCFDLFLRKI